MPVPPSLPQTTDIDHESAFVRVHDPDELKATKRLYMTATPRVFGEEVRRKATDADAVPVEIPAGTALIFNGYLLHRSLENSGRHGYRRALANNYMSAESLLPWSPPGPDEHMGIADFRDVVLVAGEDPYAYKGTVDIRKAYSRPDKDGGCDR